MKIRYGCHHFINSQPFIYPLVNRLVKHDFELIFDTPAGIADMLKRGGVDLAFIPSIEYAGSDYLLIPDHSLSSKGKVDSVLLCSKKEITKVQSIALDKRSKTSVAMLKILCNKKYRITPDLAFMEPDLSAMMKKCDAALIIGDYALKIDRDGFFVYDLGEEWHSFTQMVFVHALLAVRPDVDLGDRLNVLSAAKKEGLANREKIAREVSMHSSLSYERCFNYLTNFMTYDLGNEEIKGLQYFYSAAAECSDYNNNCEIRIYDTIPAR